MATFEPAQQSSLQAPRLRPHQLPEHLRVPALLRRHPGSRGLRLDDVGVPVCRLACGDRGKDSESGPPAVARSTPSTRLRHDGRRGPTSTPNMAQLVLPERDVGFFHVVKGSRRLW